MRNLLLIILLSFFYFTNNAQIINKYGIPLIKNYKSIEYSGSGQNWAIAQDNRGIMYFGNNDDGVLEFDGINWISHPVNNKSDIRSLAIDSNNIVFVGASGEFGYLSPNYTGAMRYHILSDQLDSSKQFKSQVLKTYAIGNKVYFCTSKNIYIYKDFKFTKNITLPQYSYLTFVINDNIYTGNYAQGLLEYNGDSLKLVVNGESFKLKSITGIIKENDNFIISTFNNGIFIYNQKTGEIKNFIKNDTINNIVKSSAIYHFIKLYDGNYAVATLFNEQGLLIFNPDGELLYKINTKFGILDNQITFLFQKKSGPIWLSLNAKGISRVDYNKPIWKFDKQNGINGGINNINYFNNNLYIGTDFGEFISTPDQNNIKSFKKINKINNQVWTSCIVNDDDKKLLLIGTIQGIFSIDEENNVKSIEKNLIGLKNPEEKFECYKLYSSKKNPGIVIVGYPSGIAIFKYENKQWYEVKRINSLGILIKEIIETNNGNLWLSSDHDGIFKVENYLNTEKISHYYTNKGIPSLKQLNFSVFNNKLYLATQKGIYSYNKQKDIFQPDSSLGEQYYKKTITIGGFQFVNNEYYFSVKDEKNKKYWIESETFSNNKIIQINKAIYNQIPNNLFEIGFFISPDKNKYFYVNDNLYTINQDIEYNLNETFNTLIRQTSLNEDSVVFYGTNYIQAIIGGDTINIPVSEQKNSESIEIPYKDNNLIFQYSANYFNQDAPLQYSVFLEGNDAKWSKWSTETRTTKNNLYEGDYTFYVKARNIYGEESKPAKFSFTILPPWYRTIWAYILYVIAFILIIYIIVKLNSRRLVKEKEQLEAIVLERTAEIRKANEEITAQRDEIAEQRDLVLKQKEHIEEIHQEITDSIHYAKRIQTAILPPEDHVTESVPEHFILFKPKDIVSGDYHWATIIRDNNGEVSKLVVTAADCTGHGVPGAFMSMLGVSFLNEIVVERKILQSNLILNNMRENVIQSLQQTGAEGEQKDGMDMALAVIDINKNILQFSGANNPLYIIRHRDLPPVTINNNNEVKFLDEGGDYILYEIKADKMPIAIYLKMDDFTLNEINYQKGDTIYMFSDGFADQFGGPKGKKFKYKPFKRILMSMQENTLAEQKEAINKAIEDWKAYINPDLNEPYEQIDDIVVIGIRL